MIESNHKKPQDDLLCCRTSSWSRFVILADRFRVAGLNGNGCSAVTEPERRVQMVGPEVAGPSDATWQMPWSYGWKLPCRATTAAGTRPSRPWVWAGTPPPVPIGVDGRPSRSGLRTVSPFSRAGSKPNWWEGAKLSWPSPWCSSSRRKAWSLQSTAWSSAAAPPCRSAETSRSLGLPGYRWPTHHPPRSLSARNRATIKAATAPQACDLT